jgi:hypothetical protein
MRILMLRLIGARTIKINKELLKIWVCHWHLVKLNLVQLGHRCNLKLRQN